METWAALAVNGRGGNAAIRHHSAQVSGQPMHPRSCAFRRSQRFSDAPPSGPVHGAERCMNAIRLRATHIASVPPTRAPGPEGSIPIVALHTASMERPGATTHEGDKGYARTKKRKLSSDGEGPDRPRCECCASP